MNLTTRIKLRLEREMHRLRFRGQSLPLEEALRRQTTQTQAIPAWRTISTGRRLRDPYLAGVLAEEELGTWALDARTLDFLAQEIAAKRPRALLEFGTGISTICLARYLQEAWPGDDAVRVFSIEQNEWQVEKSRKQLASLGLDKITRILHAPLTTQQIEGVETECYHLPTALLTEFLGQSRPEFVLVDGPSGEGDTRFGTLHLVRNYLAPEAVFYLDDALPARRTRGRTSVAGATLSPDHRDSAAGKRADPGPVSSRVRAGVQLMAKYIHIDSEVRIRTDEEAERALQSENDRGFLSESQGVVRVPLSRWRTAQSTERKHWMTLGIGSSNDRNDEHFQNFDCYRALLGQTFGSAIELGCGPFTNLRLIADVCRVTRCTLLDPLIETYLTHPNCAYTREYLAIENTRAPALARRLRRKLLRHLPFLRKPARSLHQIPITRLLSCPIEEMPQEESWELLVIVNVIEHCYDLAAVFAKILAGLKPGGVLVFHEPLFDHAVVQDRLQTLYDAAHPLQADRSLVLSFLNAHFDTLYEKRTLHENVFMGEDLSFEGIYFIGRKK